MLTGLAFFAAATTAAADMPQWGQPVHVATIPLDGAWFFSQMAVADFNADGHLDALVTRNSQDAQHTFPVTILLGDGTGKFTDGTSSVFDGTVPQTQFARQIAVADFNGDGRADAFIADHGDDHSPFPGYQNTLILSAPGGKLVNATPNLPQVYDFTHSAAAADVNGDRSVDIYVGNVYGANGIPPRILLNDGTGHFTVGAGLLPAAQTNLDQNKYDGSTFADVNGDGKPDLILAADNISPDSAVLLNDGTGHFTLLLGAFPPKPFGPDAIGLGPASYDINGDGHADLLISYTKSNPFYSGRWIQVLIGNGDGTFRDETATRLPQTVNDNPAWVEFFQLRDVDRDGRTDFGVESNGPGDTAPLVYLLDPNGVFQAGGTLGGSVQAWDFIDATGDGSNDILASSNTGDVTLIPELRGGPQQQPPPTGNTPRQDTTAPVIHALAVRPTAFRAARSGASIARTGTSVFYTTSETAATTFTVDRAKAGVRRGRACVKRTRQLARAKPCRWFVRVAGSFTHDDVSGPNRFAFTGRVGGKALAPGDYRLDATPTDVAGNVGQPVCARFRIVLRRGASRTS